MTMHNPTLALDFQTIEREKKDYFLSGRTLDYKFRIKQLKTLKASIKNHEAMLIDALYKDLRKPEFEAFTHEIGFIYKEIDHCISQLKKWMKPRSVSTELLLQPATSKIYYEPKGLVLIYGPFNYPFQLLFGPLISAISAGNVIVLKPSELAAHTEKVTQKIIISAFPKDYCEVITGPGEIVGPQLQRKIDFDHIFFTGSAAVARSILQLAADKLTTVSLELGGKSPAIIHTSARMDQAVKKIIWGKTINAGQSCVAPDYVLVHHSQYDAFVKSWISHAEEMFGKDIQKSQDYGRIINENRFDAVSSLLVAQKVIHGGSTDRSDLYIEPTLVKARMEDPIMRKEIFGPLLPVLTYNDESEILNIIRQNPNPLACYVFTTDYRFEDFIIKNFSYGGGSTNNTMSHLAVGELPFGGRGHSGMGAYHGFFGFTEFSHQKGMLKMPSIIDVSTVYPPYANWKMKLAKFFLK